jgi:hypothetical protein
MHESLRSVRWNWVGFGWFIAVSLTSLLLLALGAAGLVTGGPAESIWVSAALLLGFLCAGLFIGTRVAAAPTLHGVAIGLCSLVAWFLVNLFAGEPLEASTWGSTEPTQLAGLLAVQAAAAVVGARAGVRWMRRRSR